MSIERGFATCPVCKRNVRTASDRLCTHNAAGTWDACAGSRTFFEKCGHPGMVTGEACVLAKGHDGAHLPMRARGGL
jgi:hypothetical protein